MSSVTVKPIYRHKELTDKDFKIGDVIPIKIDNQELSANGVKHIKTKQLAG